MMDCNFLLEYSISRCTLQTQPAHTGTFAVQCVLALLSAEQLPENAELSGDSVIVQSATPTAISCSVLVLFDCVLWRDRREEQCIRRGVKR